MNRQYFLIFYYWFNLTIIKAALLFVKRSSVPVKELGGTFDSWKIPLSLITKKSLCYCVGVGEDISFERELYKLKSPNIFLFDPTPRAVSYIHRLKLPSKIKFIPWGLWHKNSKQKFFSPKNEEHVSHSIVNLHGTTSYFIAECKKIDWIMKHFKHANLDLLKIDIEGAEYEVLHHLLRTKIRPTIIAVEFDQPMAVNKTIAMTRSIIAAGYSLCDQTKWNFIFLREGIK